MLVSAVLCAQVTSRAFSFFFFSFAVVVAIVVVIVLSVKRGKYCHTR